MKIYHDFEYGGALISGFIVAKDNSFSHAFGTKKQVDLDVEDLHVMVFIADTEYDMTKALTDKEKENFKEHLLESARSQMQGPGAA